MYKSFRSLTKLCPAIHEPYTQDFGPHTQDMSLATFEQQHMTLNQFYLNADIILENKEYGDDGEQKDGSAQRSAGKQEQVVTL